MKIYLYFLYTTSILYNKFNKLNDLPYKTIRWMDYDQSFYNHIIINENISNYEQKYEKKLDLKIFKSKKLCDIPIQSVPKHVSFYLENTCDGPSKCAIYSISKDQDQSKRFIYRSIRPLQYGYKLGNEMKWKKLYYQTKFIYSKNANVYGYLTHQSPDLYFIDISKPIRSISFPILAKLENHPNDSKYLTLGFSESIIKQLNQNDRIKDYCQVNYVNKFGIISRHCGLKIDRECLWNEVSKELDFKSVEDFDGKKYLSCYTIERNNDFNDDYLKNNKCEELMEYKAIDEVDVINNLSNNDFEIQLSGLFKDLSEYICSGIEICITLTPINLVYKLVKLVAYTIKAIGFDIPSNLHDVVKEVKTYNKNYHFKYNILKLYHKIVSKVFKNRNTYIVKQPLSDTFIE